MPPIALSKTRLLSFLQCPRKLWLEQYSPELENEDAIDWAAIETGHVVGEMARRIYGANGHHRISNERGLRAAVAETAALMDAGGDDPVFEATFDFDGLTVQIDVLQRAEGRRRIVEIKSATALKDHYRYDCAIQAWTATQCGHPAEEVTVALINDQFTYAGNGDYSGLFVEADITDAVTPLLPEIPRLVEQTRAVLDQLDEPEQPIGEHCRQPHPCPFFDHCAPAQGRYPVTGLGGRRPRLYALMREGYSDLRDVPEDRLDGEAQQRIWRQTRQGEAFVGPQLRAFAEGLGFPRSYLDFESIAFAIPIWAETRPYEALPFQWSCHIETAPGRIEHREFLDISGDPPMRACATSLIEAVGTTGPVLVYTGYEKRVLAALAERHPDLASELDAIAARLVDLHPVAKAHYYHPDMLGSWSLKALLPTIAADLDYATLDEVRDGEGAQTAYLEAIRPETSDERRRTLREALLAYCRCDTLALVRLLAFFAAGAGGVREGR